MQKSKFVKALALSSSMVLVTTFLLYRAGKLDSLFSSQEPAMQTSPNGGAMASNQVDTLPIKKDTAQKTMLPSSKVLILTDKKKYEITDTSKKKPKAKPINPKRTTIMSSSKSAYMFEPETDIRFAPISAPKINIDSIKKDSAVLKYKKRQ